MAEELVLKTLKYLFKTEIANKMRIAKKHIIVWLDDGTKVKISTVKIC